jgi:hypothetical protein
MTDFLDALGNRRIWKINRTEQHKMITHKVQCRDKAEVLEVAVMCIADGFAYSVDESLVLTFWRR